MRVRDRGLRRCGIATFTFDGHDSQEVARGLRARGINVSASVVDHARRDFAPRGMTSVVRASVQHCNTREEIGRLIEALPAPG